MLRITWRLRRVRWECEEVGGGTSEKVGSVERAGGSMERWAGVWRGEPVDFVARKVTSCILGLSRANWTAANNPLKNRMTTQMTWLF